jgi:hypothetical protein
MVEHLRALVFAIWTLFHPAAVRAHAAPVIALAIAHAIAEDGPHAWSKDAAAAVMAFYAIKESWLDPNAVGDRGGSCGVWQTPCAATRGMAVRAQARYWLCLVNYAGLAGADSDPARAQRRVRIALGLLAQVEMKFAAEGEAGGELQGVE